MRNALLVIAGASLLVAAGVGACGNSSNPLRLDMAADLSSSNPNPDLSVHKVGCADLLTCTNACSTTACINTCKRGATTQAVNFFNALDMCISQTCGVAQGDAAAPPCPGAGCAACVSETQSGTSPTNMRNGMCCGAFDASNNCTMVINPQMPPCGLCIDQLIACANDATI